MSPEIATIRDAATGSSAEILVSQGFNCFRFTAMCGGQPLEVLYAPGDFVTGPARPSKGGIPLLCPFAGRIAGTTFHWEGRDYALEPGDALGNAIHGFAMWRPWRVIEHSASRIVGQFHAWRADPSLRNRWPADFKLTASYTLAGNALRGEYTIENPGEPPLPCGFGTHPYFRVPLGGASAGSCVVKLPVAARWELQNMLPTGRRLEEPHARALQAGQPYGELQLDDVFSGLTFSEGCSSASIHDPLSGHTVTQRFDSRFRELVVYTPPHREAICIEPLTSVPNCFELSRHGIDAGLTVVPPGGLFSARVEISAQ